MVSTLLTVVGQPNIPTSAGNGGFSLGFPALPSIDSISDCNHQMFHSLTHDRTLTAVLGIVQNKIPITVSYTHLTLPTILRV